MLDLIGAILVSAIKNLCNDQPDILTNTKMTRMTEWNLGHHFANEIAKYIFWLNHDLEVTKRNYNNQRPDIIFHKRGSNIFNYLVVEIKCSNFRDIRLKEDIRRIKEDWMGKPLKYRFGASVRITSTEDFAVTVFYKDSSKMFENSTKTIRKPQITKSKKQALGSLVDKILDITKDDDYLENPAKQAKVKEYEHQIDQLVYKLYDLTDEEIAIVEGQS